tara:strand:+ start:1454 stop:1885 length:432 start_codon:yes stop_codon:yes gene_type:complete
MNNESMPPELDIFISLLGEIDMLKGQVSVMDKNTHIALSHSDTSVILGNAECFSILKIIEKLNANISELNASLLNAAELVTEQYTPSDSQEKKTSNLEEAIADSREKIEKGTEQREEKKDLKKENKVINNMLSYFKERFEGNE